MNRKELQQSSIKRHPSSSARLYAFAIKSRLNPCSSLEANRRTDIGEAALDGIRPMNVKVNWHCIRGNLTR